MSLRAATCWSQGSASITGISPASAAQGSSQAVIITAEGLNFESATTTIFFQGAGISASGLSALSPTQLRATITVSISAETGLRNFRLLVGSQIVESAIPFVILPAVGVDILGAMSEFRADNSGADSVDLSVLVTISSGRQASISSVAIDLSSLGASSNQPMRDDGVEPDEVSGDSIYSTRAVVPSASLTGNYFLAVTVATSLGSRVTGGIRLTVEEASPPFILSVTPSSSLIGGVIRIRGSGFDEDLADNLVSFGDVEGVALSVSADDGLQTIEAIVPQGAISGPIVLRRGSLLSNPVQFNVGSALLSGLVTDAATGTPISGATVHLREPDGFARSDSLGRFQFEDIVAGSYELIAMAEGYHSSPPRRLTIDSPGERRLNFLLTPQTGAVAGRVISSSGGGPIEGANVLVGAMATSTNRFGNYLISGIRVGEIEIRATAHGFRDAARRVRLELDRIHEVNFALDPTIPTIAVEPQRVFAQPFDFSFTISDDSGSDSIDLSQFRFIFDGGDISRELLDALSSGAIGPVEMSGNSIRATISGVILPRGVHSIQISVKDADGNEGRAEVRYDITDVSPYLAPAEGLKARAGDGRISVLWDAPNSAEIADYEVRFGRAGRNGEIFLENSQDAQLPGSHAISGLENGRPYFISVAAISARGRGLPTPELRLTPGPPGAVASFDVGPTHAGPFQLGPGLIISVLPAAFGDPSTIIASAIDPSALARRLEDSFLVAVGDFLYDISLDGKLSSPLRTPASVALAYNPSLIPGGVPEDAVVAAISYDGYSWQIAPSSVDVENNVVVYEAPALTMAAAVLPLPVSELISEAGNFRVIFLRNAAQDYAEMIAAAFEDAWNFFSGLNFFAQFLPPREKRPLEIRILPSSQSAGRASPFGGTPFRAQGASFVYDRPIIEIGDGLGEAEIFNAAVHLLFHIIANEIYASRGADGFIISPDYLWLTEALAIFMDDMANDSPNSYRSDLNYQFIGRSLDGWSASYDPVLEEFRGDYGAFLFLKFIDETIFGATGSGLSQEQIRSRPNLAGILLSVLAKELTPRSNLNLALLASRSTATVNDLYADFAFQFWALQEMDEFIDLRGGQQPYFGQSIGDMALYEDHPLTIWRGLAAPNRFRLDPGLFSPDGTFEIELSMEALSSRGFLFELEPGSALAGGVLSLEIIPERGSLSGAAFGLRTGAEGSIERERLGELLGGAPHILERLGSGAGELGGLIIVMLNDGETGSAGRLRLRSLVVTSIEPEIADPGATIIVRGSGFSPNASDNIVIFPGGQSIPAGTVDASGSELRVTVPQGAGQGELRIEVSGLRSNGSPFISRPPPEGPQEQPTGPSATVSAVVSGAVRNNRMGITGAGVRIDPPGLTATTGHDGSFTLALEIDRGLIGGQALVSITASGFEPQQAQISLAGGEVRLDFLLSAAPISLEIEARLHHLGDDDFSDIGLGPFSGPAEGALFERRFFVDMGLATPDVYSEAVIILDVSQVQLNNPISVNGSPIGTLNTNGRDLTFRFDPRLLRPGENSLRIQSIAAAADPRFVADNLDDFEFSNVRLNIR